MDNEEPSNNSNCGLYRAGKPRYYARFESVLTEIVKKEKKRSNKFSNLSETYTM